MRLLSRLGVLLVLVAVLAGGHVLIVRAYRASHARAVKLCPCTGGAMCTCPDDDCRCGPHCTCECCPGTCSCSP